MLKGRNISMKKIVLAILIVAVLCGVGYLGYIIYQSSNIKSVELVGNVQSLYLVGDEINYGDAELKVTYKSGNIKMVKLNDKSVKVSMFSTSERKHGKMNIIYKDYTMKVDYDVMNTGYYYLSEISTVTTSAPAQPVSYTHSNTIKAIYLDTNGVAMYFIKGDFNNGYTLFDGHYDSNYNYKISGNTLTVNIGKDKKIEIKAIYENENWTYQSESIITNDNGLQSSKTTQKFTPYATRSIRVKTDESLNYSKVLPQNLEVEGSNSVVKIKVGSKDLSSAGCDVYIFISFGEEDFLSNVYVKINNAMINGGKGIDTQNYVNYTGRAAIRYDGFGISVTQDLLYKVVSSGTIL